MDEKRTIAASRRDYLFACGLAMIAAVLGVVAPAPGGGAIPGGRATTILVALAATGIFVMVALRLRGDAGDGGDRPEPRLRKMTLIWLALAALLGAAAVRAPALALWSGGPGALEAGQWLAALAGCAVVLVAAARGAALFRR